MKMGFPAQLNYPRQNETSNKMVSLFNEIGRYAIGLQAKCCAFYKKRVHRVGLRAQ